MTIVTGSSRRRLVFTGLLLVLLLVASGLGGCSTLGYYQQAASGQLRLLYARRSVDKLLAEPETDPKLVEQLRLAGDALVYAREVLLLKVGKRYGSYTQLKGDFVVWNLVVAEPDSVEPREWCFPVAGCVGYRGYFNEARAQRVAQQFQAKGYDVYVGGVAAYSTLGWFNDPLLSSFIHWSRPALVQLLFHELAHGELYVAGDTEFNESFASFVAQKAIASWLADDLEAGPELRRERKRRLELARFNGLLIKLRNALKADFAAAASAEQALEVRVQRYAEARGCVASWSKTLGTETDMADRLNRYFAQPPNMARLALASAYNRWIPAFEQLFAESQPPAAADQPVLDWAAFYAAARELGELEPPERQNELQRLASASAELQKQVQADRDDEDPGEIRCEALTNHSADGDVAG